jgi:hypothetical protein
VRDTHWVSGTELENREMMSNNIYGGREQPTVIVIERFLGHALPHIARDKCLGGGQCASWNRLALRVVLVDVCASCVSFK